MKLLLIVPLIVIVFFFEAQSFAQQPTDTERKEGELDPKFAAMGREVGFVCGEFLPNQIPRITEMMALCGGHVGFKVADALFFEPQILAGAGHAQKYLIGSASIRGDFQVDDFILSADIGADIHYATEPANLLSSVASQTDIYFGGHVGSMLWWEISQFFALRMDMQFYLNPGTSLFVGVGLVMRFDPGSGSGNSSQ